MSIEITKGYAGYPAKVIVREGDTEYVIEPQTICFDQFDHGTAFLKVEQREIERTPRCQAAVPRRAKDYEGTLPRSVDNPNELVVDQCRKAAKRGHEVCAQHTDTSNGMVSDPELYVD